jgi:RimJ/RimL family protein N-acetyltransferase
MACGAEALPENTAMLKVLERGGLELQGQRENGTVHVTL